MSLVKILQNIRKLKIISSFKSTQHQKLIVKHSKKNIIDIDSSDFNEYYDSEKSQEDSALDSRDQSALSIGGIDDSSLENSRVSNQRHSSA